MAASALSFMNYSKFWCHPAWVVKMLVISVVGLMLLVSIITLPFRCQAPNWMLLASRTVSSQTLLMKDSSDPTLNFSHQLDGQNGKSDTRISPAPSPQMLLPEISSNLSSNLTDLPNASTSPAPSPQMLLPEISSNSSSNLTDLPNASTRQSTSTLSNIDTIKDASCVSKWQHLMYRTSASVLNFPSILAEDLKAYEKMHARCTHNKTWRDTFYNPDHLSCKYLVYVEGTAGLGNRLLALASAFVYALLTDRVLLMDPRGHLPLLLCEPFESSSWRLPTDFPIWDLEYGSPSLGAAHSAGFNSSRLLLTLRHEQSDGDKQFYCTHILEKLNKVPWIGWNSNQYFIPRFFTLAPFWPRLLRLFPNVSLTSTYLGRYLFLPNNEVWDRIVRIHWSYFACSRKKVSIQVRLHARQDLAEFYPPAFRQMMRCLIGYRILPNVTEDPQYHSNVHIQHLFSKQSKSRFKADVSACKMTTSVLLASLQIKYYEELKTLYTNSPTEDESFVRVHMATHDGAEMYSYDQSLKAFTEIWLLSLGDEIVTSSWSTFGYVAQSLGALRPYVMNIRGGFDNEGLPPCHVGQSSDPCNHYPFMRQSCESKTLSSEHTSWIQAHLRPCQDEGAGIQLVHPSK